MLLFLFLYCFEKITNTLQCNFTTKVCKHMKMNKLEVALKLRSTSTMRHSYNSLYLICNLIQAFLVLAPLLFVLKDQ